jgi:Ser/Thr protein kinase RdoA (MazF antagonist)
MKPAPPPAIAATVARALEHFPIEVARTEFVSASENTVYRVEAGDGRAYALRVHRPGYHELAELESENAWTTALSDAGIDTPRPLATRDGSGYATVAYGDGGERRHVGMIEWIDGEPFLDVRERGRRDLAIFRDLGALIGRMNALAATWEPPHGFVRHRLDADGLIGEEPWWGPFWHVPEFSPAERALVLDLRARIRRALADLGTDRDRFGLIHADLLAANLLVRPHGGVAAIDFDDTAFGWYLYDIAVALYEVSKEPRYETLRDALLAGYRRHRPLPEADAALLPVFVLIRCLVEIGWFDSRLQGHLTNDRGEPMRRETLIPPLIRQAIALCEAVRPLV